MEVDNGKEVHVRVEDVGPRLDLILPLLPAWRRDDLSRLPAQSITKETTRLEK